MYIVTFPPFCNASILILHCFEGSLYQANRFIMYVLEYLKKDNALILTYALEVSWVELVTLRWKTLKHVLYIIHNERGLIWNNVAAMMWLWKFLLIQFLFC